jgi:FkbM family methyltransferase
MKTRGAVKMRPVAWLARNWPFTNGSGRFLDKYGKGIELGSGERLVDTSDGFPLHVFANDLIGRHILLTGRFDRSVVQVLLDHARPGDTLLDIGANIGYVSAVFLRSVSGSSAVCVEPQPGVVDLLRKNMEQFDGRAEIIQAGLADRDGTLRFHVNAANRGSSRIRDDGEIEITVREASKVLSAIPRVDLIKLDVEGFEEPIFRSIEDELKRLAPRAVLFEDETGMASPNGKIGAILTRVGYRVYGIHKRLLKTELVQIDSRSDCRFNDYLALQS